MKNIKNASNIKVIEDNELKAITGGGPGKWLPWLQPCLLYTSDAADE